MLDIQQLRSNLDAVAEGLARRGKPIGFSGFTAPGAERKSLVMTEEEKMLTAYHEGGHAIVAFNVKAADPVHKATIVPRGRSLGHRERAGGGDHFQSHGSLLRLKWG